MCGQSLALCLTQTHTFTYQVIQSTKNQHVRRETLTYSPHPLAHSLIHACILLSINHSRTHSFICCSTP